MFSWTRILVGDSQNLYKFAKFYITLTLMKLKISLIRHRQKIQDITLLSVDFEPFLLAWYMFYIKEGSYYNGTLPINNVRQIRPERPGDKQLQTRKNKLSTKVQIFKERIEVCCTAFFHLFWPSVTKHHAMTIIKHSAYGRPLTIQGKYIYIYIYFESIGPLGRCFL